MTNTAQHLLHDNNNKKNNNNNNTIDRLRIQIVCMLKLQNNNCEFKKNACNVQCQSTKI